MHKFYKVVLLSALFVCFTTASASQEEAVELAKKLQLVPGTKASIQWKRIFTSKPRRKRYGLDTLSEQQFQLLRRYLIEHAADSPKPIVPGL